MDGHAGYIIDKVGDATEIGKVARQSTEESVEPTPLNLQLERLAKLIGNVGFTVAALAFGVFFVKDVLLHYDFSNFHTFGDWMPALQDTLQYFMMAVTLIVVAVPEGLPMSVTLSLALNMRRMLKTNNLVRKMHASETMGAVTVICTDKTGTLTQNLMQVQEMVKLAPDIVPDALFHESIAVNSTAFLEKAENEKPHGVGNPTEVALLLWLYEQGVDYLKLREEAEIIDQLTFSTERKYMATLVNSKVNGKRMLYVKGAPEIVLSLCNEPKIGSKAIDAQLLAFQERAMRTLGFACREVQADEPQVCKDLISKHGLAFTAIAAISDPVRADVPAAVQKCQQAGIVVR